MKTAIYTGYDASYRDLAAITVPTLIQNAKLGGADFIAFDSPPNGLNIYWTGVARGLELLRDGYERVVYVDVDQICTNPFKLFWAGAEYGWHASKDWGTDAVEPWHFSACGMVAHRDTIPLYEECLAMEPDWRDKPFQEQGPLREVVRKLYANSIPKTKAGNETGLINIHPRRTFNAVPIDICDQIPEPWQPGDWCAHLTMVPVAKRIELATKILHNL